jgi:hypothetical protein
MNLQKKHFQNHFSEMEHYVIWYLRRLLSEDFKKIEGTMTTIFFIYPFVIK